MKSSSSCILLLFITGKIYADDVGFVDDKFLPCPSTVEDQVNTILGTVTTTLNKGWAEISKPLDPIKINLPLPDFPPMDSVMANVFIGNCDILNTVEKAKLAVNIPAITGISNLKFKELKVENHAAGKGNSCKSDPKAGPFRCVLEGGFQADAGVEEGLKVHADVDLTLICKSLWGKISTKNISMTGSCSVAEDILDLKGTYCAGQCSNMTPMVSSVKVSEARFKLGDISCDLGNVVVEGLLNGVIETLVADKLSVDMAEPINHFLKSKFPVPWACPAEKVGYLRVV